MATFYRAFQPASLRQATAHARPSTRAPASSTQANAGPAPATQARRSRAARVAQVPHKAYQWQAVPVQSVPLWYTVYPGPEQHWPVDNHCVRSEEQQRPAAPATRPSFIPREQVQSPGAIYTQAMHGWYTWMAFPA